MAIIATIQLEAIPITIQYHILYVVLCYFDEYINLVQIVNNLQFPRKSPDKILKFKVTTAMSKVKSWSHYDVAHLYPPTNVATIYQHLTPQGFFKQMMA